MLGYVCDDFRKPIGRVLRRQFVERAVVLPADHVFAGDLADDLVAAFFLEDLLERLELGDAFEPFLAFELFFEALCGESALGDVVTFVLVFYFQVGEGGVERDGAEGGGGAVFGGD